MAAREFKVKRPQMFLIIYRQLTVTRGGGTFFPHGTATVRKPNSCNKPLPRMLYLIKLSRSSKKEKEHASKRGVGENGPTGLRGKWREIQ